MKRAHSPASAAWLLILAASAAAALSGCGERCDPGYHLDRHICYADTAATSEAGAAGATSDAATCPGPGVTTFAADCKSSADCVCDSDFCAGYPGQTGFCTRSGCDKDPTLCPSGYTCMDLSSFGVGHICTPS